MPAYDVSFAEAKPQGLSARLKKPMVCYRLLAYKLSILISRSYSPKATQLELFVIKLVNYVPDELAAKQQIPRKKFQK